MEKVTELVETLAEKLQLLGNNDSATRLLDALYGASTGGEMVMRLRHEMRKIDRKQLGHDIAILVQLEQLLP